MFTCEPINWILAETRYLLLLRDKCHIVKITNGEKGKCLYNVKMVCQENARKVTISKGESIN
jgi:hypothetical protein